MSHDTAPQEKMLHRSVLGLGTHHEFWKKLTMSTKVLLHACVCVWRFYLFIFRERRREEKGEKHWCATETSVGYLSHTPQRGTWPTTQACAQSRNWISNLSICRMTPNPLSHTGQGIDPVILSWIIFSLYKISRVPKIFSFHLNLLEVFFLYNHEPQFGNKDWKIYSIYSCHVLMRCPKMLWFRT